MFTLFTTTTTTDNYMFNLTSEQSLITTSIVANLVLSLSVELQKYAKKQIIELALHGLPSVSLERIWKLGFSLLVVAECLYYVWYGLSGTTSMTPMGVYTMFANCVIPPLFYEARSRPWGQTTLGTTCTMIGIMCLILVPAQEKSSIDIQWGDSLNYTMVGFLALCIALCGLRSYKPANCCLKLIANCGLSGMMGSFAVCLIKALTSEAILDGGYCGIEGKDPYGLCDYLPVGWLLVLVIFALQMVILSEILEYFSVWQVLAHHHILFSISLLTENITVFHAYDQNKKFAVSVACLSHFLIIVGVWVAARPQLDIPASIASSKILPRLMEVYQKNIERNNHSSNQFMIDHVNEEGDISELYRLQAALLKEMNMCCINQFYCDAMHEHLKQNQGFRKRNSRQNASTSSSLVATPYSDQEAEP